MSRGSPASPTRINGNSSTSSPNFSDDQVIGTYPGELFANLKMNGHYFNFGKANWEPMLEDWEYKLRV